MRALLDTHTFLWWNLNDPRLSDQAREWIADGQNEFYLSAGCAWEIAIKARRGSLILPEPADVYVTSRLRLHHILSLPIHLNHVLRVYYLPDHHRDPFDRLLVAQSQVEGMPILSSDSEIRRYEVEVIW